MGKSFDDQVVTIRLPRPATGVDLTNDGTRVAVALPTASGIPSVCVYDTATGEQVASFGLAAHFGRGVAFGDAGRCLYGLVDDADCRTLELCRYALDGGQSVTLAAYPHGEYYRLVRNEAADLLALLGEGVQVLHVDDGTSRPELVRIIPGLEQHRLVNAEFPAQGAHVYCSGVAKDQVVRWDLERNRADGSWPAPGTYGGVAISRSGRYCITSRGGRGVFALDAGTGRRFMPELFHERRSAPSTLSHLTRPGSSTRRAYTQAFVTGRQDRRPVGRGCSMDVSRVSTEPGPQTCTSSTT